MIMIFKLVVLEIVVFILGRESKMKVLVMEVGVRFVFFCRWWMRCG